MHTRLKFFLLCGHFFALAATLFWVFQGVNPVYEKGLVSILIFITLNLIRLFQKENRNDSNDQF